MDDELKQLTDDERVCVQAAISVHFDPETLEAMRDIDAGRYTHEQVAVRWGVTRQAVSQRINRASTYARRLALAIGSFKKSAIAAV